MPTRSNDGASRPPPAEEIPGLHLIRSQIGSSKSNPLPRWRTSYLLAILGPPELQFGFAGCPSATD